MKPKKKVSVKHKKRSAKPKKPSKKKPQGGIQLVQNAGRSKKMHFESILVACDVR